ncbi:MAG: pentapeptide repeat-containing protein, partial [Pseudanabaena sp.]
NLTNAKLNWANLANAKLIGADLTGTYLSTLKSIEGTNFTDARNAPNSVELVNMEESNPEE